MTRYCTYQEMKSCMVEIGHFVLSSLIQTMLETRVIPRRYEPGYVFTFCGGAISWKSKQQSSVVLPSTEAEYVAATETCKEIICLDENLSSIYCRYTFDPTTIVIVVSISSDT